MKSEIKVFETMQYILRYPRNFDAGKRWPLILFLHGAGTRGKQIAKLQDNVFFPLTTGLADFPFVVAAPHCSVNTWFDCFEELRRFACEMAKLPFVDSERVYLMGASMGGYGAWQLAMSLPELFAAAVPICGGGMYWNAARLVNVPIWAFHGQLDPTVNVEESIRMVNAVNTRGGRARLTVYPENAHNAWSDTFRNPEVYTWLLAQKKAHTKEAEDAYRDGKRFG